MLTRFDLHDYQDRGVDHIKQHEASALWIDMGLGKTVTALTAIRDLSIPTLVAAPLRVARDVWIDEIETWLHLQGLTAARIIGTEAERERGLATKADVHLINREQMLWLEQHFLEQVGEYKWKQIARWPWSMVVFDESQGWKHQGAWRHKMAWRMRNFFKPKMVQLTGTPAPNGYQDIWGQVRLLDGGQRLGRSEKAYLERWFNPPGEGQYKWKLKPGADKEIQAKVADIVVSMKAEDYLDLPPVVYNPIKVHLPPETLRTYKKFERESVMRLKGHTITAVNSGSLHVKLLQAANGALYTGEGRAYELFHNEKVDTLLEVLEGLSEPVIIGYAFQHDLARIESALAKFCGKKKLWRRLKSADSLKEFAGGLVSYGVIHPGTGGHGLNDLYLSGAENLVWFGLTEDLEMWDQLNARLIGGHRRLGRNCVIHALVAEGTIDGEALDVLRRKGVDQEDLTRALVRKY